MKISRLHATTVLMVLTAFLCGCGIFGKRSEKVVTPSISESNMQKSDQNSAEISSLKSQLNKLQEDVRNLAQRNNSLEREMQKANGLTKSTTELDVEIKAAIAAVNSAKTELLVLNDRVAELNGRQSSLESDKNQDREAMLRSLVDLGEKIDIFNQRLAIYNDAIKSLLQGKPAGVPPLVAEKPPVIKPKSPQVPSVPTEAATRERGLYGFNGEELQILWQTRYMSKGVLLSGGELNELFEGYVAILLEKKPNYLISPGYKVYYVDSGGSIRELFTLELGDIIAHSSIDSKERLVEYRSYVKKAKERSSKILEENAVREFAAVNSCDYYIKL